MLGLSSWRFLVVGAGPAGSAAAFTLAEAGHRVHLVEQGTFDQPRVGELLSPEGQIWVEKLLPADYRSFYLTELGVVESWSEKELRRSSEASWWALDRTGLDRALARKAESAGAYLQLGVRVKGLVRTGERWHYTLDDQEYTADWVIIASGRGGGRLVSAELQRFDRQVALVGFLEGEYSSTPDMLLESTEHGWWYGAPLDSQRAVAVFVTDSDLDKGDAEETWKRRLLESQYARERFSGLRLAQKPRRVAGGYSLLRPAYGPGWVAVGEAAAAFCPLSSMGVGRAIETGVRLGECFVRAEEEATEPNLLALAEQNGAEFHLYHQLLSNSYRQVFHFPNSVYWDRRATEGEESLRFKARPSAKINLIFPEGQNFECTRCGKCCGSGWMAWVEPEQRLALGELTPRDGYLPLRVFDDGRVVTNIDEDGHCVFLEQESCELHDGGQKPYSCRQFPFILKDTPQGVVVGLSFLCNSVQQNTGRPVEQYRPQILELLTTRRHPVLPPQVPVSWGRIATWQQYTAWERELLASESRLDSIRRLRWKLAFWLRDLPTPREWDLEQLQWLEKAMAAYLMASLEGAALEAIPEVAGAILEEDYLKLDQRYPVKGLGWFEAEVERFLNALIQRKYLLSHVPLYHKLNMLAALPCLLENYATSNAWQDGADKLQPSHLHQALDTVELRVAAHGRQDLMAQAFFHWHMILSEGEPSFQPDQKTIFYGYCFEPPPFPEQSKIQSLTG